MNWTPPGNRNNQHIARWRAELYPLPKQDKTGILTRITKQANKVLERVTFLYRVGHRVQVQDPISYSWQTGRIVACEYVMGRVEYRVRLDDGRMIWAPERDGIGRLRVHSLMLAVA